MAGDEEVVRFFDTDSLMCICEFKAHENRYYFLNQSVCMCVCVCRAPVGVAYTVVSESRVGVFYEQLQRQTYLCYLESWRMGAEC